MTLIKEKVYTNRAFNEMEFNVLLLNHFKTDFIRQEDGSKIQLFLSYYVALKTKRNIFLNFESMVIKYFSGCIVDISFCVSALKLH